MNVSGQMAMPERLRILAADLSLRCPGFAVLQYEAARSLLCGFAIWTTAKAGPSHGEILSAICDLITG